MVEKRQNTTDEQYKTISILRTILGFNIFTSPASHWSKFPAFAILVHMFNFHFLLYTFFPVWIFSSIAEEGYITFSIT